MDKISGNGAFHYSRDGSLVVANAGATGSAPTFSYKFETFGNPFVGDLISQLNATSLDEMLAPSFLGKLTTQYAGDYTPLGSGQVTVKVPDVGLDRSLSGPNGLYTWELTYFAPVAMAVHLSNNQRFAEAKKWFERVFDPFSPDGQYWKSYVFQNSTITNITELIALLSTPDSQLDAALIAEKADVITGYNAILAKPFQPHVVARTRPSAYQWYVVMKYLDNLIAWGDSLFLADTVETLNEATLCYVLAAQLLGPRPQSVPQPGGTTPRNFLQLKQAGLDAMADAMVTLEGQFPFNLVPGPGAGSGGAGQDLSGALFGIGRSLYFAIPPDQNMLAYWDIVADRLFKIRNSENIQGVVQQLPLFDPPIDPGMLVKAAAAGLDIGSIVSGLNQPVGPVRAPMLIQKALEIAGEVRSLGNALLSAYEKGDAEQFAQKRAGHEVALQAMVQNARFAQYQHAVETTNGLLRSRDTVIERYTYYRTLLGQPPDPKKDPAIVPIAPEDLAQYRGQPAQADFTEQKFTDHIATLLTNYDQAVTLPKYPDPQLAQGSSPSDQSGATGPGQLYLNQQEDAELNIHLPIARDRRTDANVANTVAGAVAPIPSVEGHLAWWGIGVHSVVFSGQILAGISKIASDVLQTTATYNENQASLASRTAGYQRRTMDWTLQANLAARELMQLGRQVVASLIAEQAAYLDYDTAKNQVTQATDVQTFLQQKFSSADLYTWMQSNLTGLYYQYYRLACDTARKAEQTMKQELMRPELDSTQFVQYNYWDSGHQGLLSGEALYLDIKRMELAYHDSNKRELELTRHVSLRQLDPLALLALKVTGSCTVTIPEWLYDLDGPGHYFRRVKALAVSTPSVTGPNTSLNMTVTLNNSTIRTSPLLANGGYARDITQDDDRFLDSYGSTDVIVTSGGTNDSGMFETNLRDERFLPFEGAGAVSTWNLSLPAEIRSFDYMTISDVILHVRYTARDAGNPLRGQATKELKGMLDSTGTSGQALLFCLRYDFPTEWSAFVNGTANFTVTLDRQFFPYAVQAASGLAIDGLTLYTSRAASPSAPPELEPTAPLSPADLAALSAGLAGSTGQAPLSLPVDDTVLTRDPTKQVFLVLQYHFTAP